MASLPRLPEQLHELIASSPTLLDLRHLLHTALERFSPVQEHFSPFVTSRLNVDAGTHRRLLEIGARSWHSVFSPVAIGSLLAAMLAAYVVYQLYFHPLAQYPGPLLGRLTQWYDVYHAYVGDKHILFYHLHRRYGVVVRFSPNSLSINDPAALKAIYSHGANVQKSVFYKCFRAAPHAISTLLATEKHHHARKRRIMGQAFSDSALKGFEQYVLGHVQDLVDRIGAAVQQQQLQAPGPAAEKPASSSSSWSGSLDMANWCNWLVFDIMGDLVFGRSFGTLGAKPENRRGIYLLGRAARRNYTVAAMPALLSTGLEKVLPLLRGLYLDRGQYLAFGKKQVLERSQLQQTSPSSLDGRRDIFSFLLHAKDPESGEGMPMPELWMEGNTLIVAGSDTTSTTLAASLHYLLRNPTTLARLTREIRTAFASSAEIRMNATMQRCAYLRAVLDETMRMTPAVGGLLPREVLPGGLAIPALGLHLPAGVDVGVPTYAIQHDAASVPEPFRFAPERFLLSSTSSPPPSATTGIDASEPPMIPHQDRDALLAVWNPFSLGPRACLGKPLVYMELGIALARLVWEFDLRLAPDQHVSEFVRRDVRVGIRDPAEYPLLDWFMSRNEGPHVEFRVRQDGGEE